MAHHLSQLTSGALAKVCTGGDIVDPVLQVLGNKAIAGGGSERFRLLLSDGVYTNSFSMLATQLNHMVHDNKLSQFTIIRVKKFQCSQMAGGSKKVVILLDLEVVLPGEQVGVKLGSPVQIGADGVVPPAGGGNQNANPNVGAGAPKRPATTPLSGGSENKLPTKPSVLQPRQSVGASSGVLTTPIASITPYQNKWTIKARVTSRSDIRTWNKASGSGKLYSMDLMDESGEIRLTAFKEQCDKFYDMTVVGNVYYISNCTVKAANKQYSKLNNDYELTFKDNGTMEPVEEGADDVPAMTYNFARISDLQSAEKDQIVDVLGVCKACNEAVDFVSRAGKEMKKREITLVDKSSTEVSLTLWGSTAANFEGAGNPIVAVKGVKVSDFNGVSLSGGEIMLNPDIDVAHELKGWWDNIGCNSTTTSITVQGQRSGGGDAGATKTLGEVKQEGLGNDSDRGEYYSVSAMITFYQKDKALYKSCGKEIDGRACMKKVVEMGENSYRCEKCAEEKSTFQWRIMLQLNMADSTDNTWASAFQDTAEKILGINAHDLGTLNETDEERYSSVFTDATFKEFNFRMRVKADTYNDETRLKHTVVDVSEISWAEQCKKMIAEIESCGGSIPDSISKMTYN